MIDTREFESLIIVQTIELVMSPSTLQICLPSNVMQVEGFINANCQGVS
jgi:hypothetical protein